MAKSSSSGMKRLSAPISKDSATISFPADAGDECSRVEFENRALAACPRTIRRNKMTGDQMVGPTIVQIRMGIGPALINGKRTTSQEAAFRSRVDGPGNTTLDFDLWSSVSNYRPESYDSLDWWQAYNNLKHDRLMNREQATLKRAVCALAGLFVAILRCEYCRNDIAQAGWLSGNNHRPEAWLGEDSPHTPSEFIAAESKLFSYPVGWCEAEIQGSQPWAGPASHRFKQWFDGYEQAGR